jgi:hypothetical protein
MTAKFPLGLNRVPRHCTTGPRSTEPSAVSDRQCRPRRPQPGTGAIGSGPAARPLRLSQLSGPRQRLVQKLQLVNHGRIERLPVQDGEPVFNPPLIIKKTHVCGKRNGPNTRHGTGDFTLKHEVLDLLEVFDRDRSLVIEDLVIADGLPVKWDTVVTVDGTKE